MNEISKEVDFSKLPNQTNNMKSEQTITEISDNMSIKFYKRKYVQLAAIVVLFLLTFVLLKLFYFIPKVEPMKSNGKTYDGRPWPENIPPIPSATGN